MSTPRLQIEAESIPRIEVVKSLGVHIDQTLSWSKHVERISMKISFSIEGLHGSHVGWQEQRKQFT